MNPRTFCQTRGVQIRGAVLEDLRMIWAAQNPRGFAQNSSDAPAFCGEGDGRQKHPPPFLKNERCAICNGLVEINKRTSWVEIAIDRVAVLRADESFVDTGDPGWRGVRPVGPACARQFSDYTFCWTSDGA